MEVVGIAKRAMGWESREGEGDDGEEQVGQCGPKVGWTSARSAGQRKRAMKGKETGAGRLAGWVVAREREGRRKIPFLLFQNLFQNHFKSNLNWFKL